MYPELSVKESILTCKIVKWSYIIDLELVLRIGNM